jgi:hypothetical protein
MSNVKGSKGSKVKAQPRAAQVSWTTPVLGHAWACIADRQQSSTTSLGLVALAVLAGIGALLSYRYTQTQVRIPPH